MVGLTPRVILTLSKGKRRYYREWLTWRDLGRRLRRAAARRDGQAGASPSRRFITPGNRDDAILCNRSSLLGDFAGCGGSIRRVSCAPDRAARDAV